MFDQGNKPTPANVPAHPEVSLVKFQQLIKEMYYDKDLARGVAGTFLWFMEEIGELSSALRQCSATTDKNDSQWAAKRQNLQEEFADVLAWLATMANVMEIDLNRAISEKYGSGCPGCEQFLCICPDSEKP